MSKCYIQSVGHAKPELLPTHSCLAYSWSHLQQYTNASAQGRSMQLPSTTWLMELLKTGLRSPTSSPFIGGHLSRLPGNQLVIFNAALPAQLRVNT